MIAQMELWKQGWMSRWSCGKNATAKPLTRRITEVCTEGHRANVIRLAKRLCMAANPVDDSDEAEFVAIHGAGDELVPGCAFEFDVEAVTAQKNVGGGEGDALVAVEEAVVVAERFHERGGIFFE